MMRSLWTASSGMLSQQTSLDTIANNLSNINTIGYKKETVEFKTLLYQTLVDASTDSDGNPKATAIQVGSGVRNSAITSQYTQGALNATEGPFDLAIQGNGFFMVQDEAGQTAYTRSGNFQMAIGVDGLPVLSTSDGHQVLSDQGQAITVKPEWNVKDIIVDEAGQFIYVDKSGETTNYEVIGKLGIAQFNNPSGLTKAGGSMLYASGASGEPRIEGIDGGLSVSIIKQGYLEASNVQAVDEMVNMITTQRAYELNSKIITASDEMLQQANNLRR